MAKDDIAASSERIAADVCSLAVDVENISFVKTPTQQFEILQDFPY